ncbi:MAG: hypothetical protein PHC61_06680, partial [Chitinivibrionales bacterium]|nr:hypothetical protein [Chitinivibrionales bacterium]
LLGTNVLDAGAGIIKSKVIKTGKYSIMVVSVIGPALIAKPELQKSLAPPADVLGGFLNSAEAARCALRVCIVHDSWESLKKALPPLPPNTIILCGSLSQAFETPMNAGGALLLSPGRGGQYVGCLAVRLNAAGVPVAFENKLVPLTDETAADSLISDQIQAIAMSADLLDQGIDEGELKAGTVEGVFPFVSNRHGAAAIFLKIAGKPSEFPLTLPPNACANPCLSSTAGKIIYFEYPKAASGGPAPQDTQAARGFFRGDTGMPVLKIMDLNGAQKRTLLPDHLVRGACFSPDGRWVYACVSPRQDTAAGALVRLTPEGKRLLTLVKWPGCYPRDVAVARDGKALAFTCNREGTWQLYCADSAGAEIVRVSNRRADFGAPQFSGDGKHLAFLSDEAAMAGRKDLFLYDLAAGSERAITHHANVGDYCWLDEGETLVFNAGVNARDCNFVTVATGETFKLIPATAVKDYSESNPAVIHCNKKLKIVYTREYFDGRAKIYWVNPDGSEDRQLILGDHNDWLR